MSHVDSVPVHPLHSRRAPAGAVEDAERLALWLRRLLSPSRFGPLSLRLRGGGRVEVLRPQDAHVDLDAGTLRVGAPDGVQEVPLEEVLTVELHPRPQAARRHLPHANRGR